MTGIEKQNVWRTMSESKYDGGFRVWEILEVMGRIDRASHIVARDGTQFIVQCYHYWTKNQAELMMNDKEYLEFQNVHTI